MTVLYENLNEKKQHQSAIEKLSTDTGVDRETIQGIYENELYQMKQHALVKDFLSIFVMKNVKNIINKRSS